MGMGKSSGTIQQVQTTTTATPEPEPTVTSAVAKNISQEATKQIAAQDQARQRKSGIVSTYRRYAGADQTDTKNKLGQ